MVLILPCYRSFSSLLLFSWLAQFLFLRRLQEVLETREEKTVKLENSADDILEKVTRMQGEYKTKMEDANRTTLKTATDQKQLDH